MILPGGNLPPLTGKVFRHFLYLRKRAEQTQILCTFNVFRRPFGEPFRLKQGWMKKLRIAIGSTCLILFSACSVVEQSSRHGFESGNYTVKSDGIQMKKAYVEVQDDTINVYGRKNDSIQLPAVFSLNLSGNDSLCRYDFSFNKQSLDIDITSILFKYRPGQQGRPDEFTADFNAALYSGWRWDYYTVKTRKDPLQKCNKSIGARGFDIGAFAGLGTTPVNSFSTGGAVTDDYSGMIFQYGLAAFVETTFVSFGLSAGFDALLTPDNKTWIYHRKPWLGFVVGIALN
jgi:hypothetical protein